MLKESAKNATLFPGAWRSHDKDSVVINVDGSWVDNCLEIAGREHINVGEDRWLSKKGNCWGPSHEK